MTLASFVRPLAAALLLVSLLAAPAAAQDATFDFKRFFVFGDSLADTGNVWLTSKVIAKADPTQRPAPPPSETPHRTYYDGRFSNGPVFAEYLWQELSGAAPGSSMALRRYIEHPFIGSSTSLNFAFGGTGTPMLDQTPGGLYAPGLKGQVELFRLAMAGRRATAKDLFLVVTGANDYRDDEFNTFTPPDVVVARIAESITRLYQTGARAIVVIGLPDLGRLPFADPSASQHTQAHNMALQGALATLQASLPEARLTFVDMNGAFDVLPAGTELEIPALIAYGAGLPSPRQDLATCLFTDPKTCINVPFAVGAPFAFWDIVHPTTTAHQVLGGFVADQMRAQVLATH